MAGCEAACCLLGRNEVVGVEVVTEIDKSLDNDFLGLALEYGFAYLLRNDNSPIVA